MIPEHFTQEQQAVVTHLSGHARVRAVAGSGKTTTLVERVLYLLRQGVAARRLLIVMYNRSAKDDFRAKLAGRAEALQFNGPLPDVRTFHSLGHRLTRSLVSWGFLQPRRLYQEEWMQSKLMQQALKRLADQQGEAVQPWLEEEALDAFKSFCTRVKSGLLPAGEVAEQLDLTSRQQHFVAAFNELEELLHEQRACFFDDLLWRPLQAIQQHPELKQRLAGFLDHLLVDEYQDINEVQQALLTTLAGSAQVMVVGDVDQCIYEWRGARPDYMLHRFQQDFQPVTDYPLSGSFRFGHSLALVANQVIQHNAERPPQLTWSLAPGATSIALGQGASWLLAQLTQWQQKQPQGKAAVLVRSWSQSLNVQLEMLKAHQPFQLARQEHFIFNRPQIHGLLAYARLAIHSAPGQKINYQHPAAQDDFYQLLSFPSLFLTEAERQQLVQARTQGLHALDSLLDTWSLPKQRRVIKRLKLLQKLSVRAATLSPAAFLTEVLDATNALEQVRKTAASKEAAEEALRLMEGLLRFSQQAKQSLGEWLEDLYRAQQEGIASLTTASTQQVQILTVHAAKGLEWDWVGIYGLNEGDFPYSSGFSQLTVTELEAERRLFYVASTRARSQLVLAEGDTAGPVSRFVQEAAIDDALFLAQCLQQPAPAPARDVAYPALLQDYWRGVAAGAPPPDLYQRRQAAEPRVRPQPLQRQGWALGARVEHPTFGQGTLMALEGNPPERLFDVRFDQVGLKRLKEEFAKLKLLSGA